jgi:hypothetical protein
MVDAGQNSSSAASAGWTSAERETGEGEFRGRDVVDGRDIRLDGLHAGCDVPQRTRRDPLDTKYVATTTGWKVNATTAPAHGALTRVRRCLVRGV